MSIDPASLRAWMTGRSLARGLPPPVADHGGFRVDTGTADEVARWVFPHASSALADLARTIDAPYHSLKLCGTVDELCALLPPRWRPHAQAWVMIPDAWRPVRAVPPGYDLTVARTGNVVHVRIATTSGEAAAGGYLADTPDMAVFDRIAVAGPHRRRGLGGAVMAALHDARRDHRTPEMLTATADGRALYATLGWRVVSGYSTASLPAS